MVSCYIGKKIRCQSARVKGEIIVGTNDGIIWVQLSSFEILKDVVHDSLGFFSGRRRSLEVVEVEVLYRSRSRSPSWYHHTEVPLT